MTRNDYLISEVKLLLEFNYNEFEIEDYLYGEYSIQEIDDAIIDVKAMYEL